jgi:hypothetical protein
MSCDLRLFSLIIFVAAARLANAAEPPAAASSAISPQLADAPLLPTHIKGYTLRVLNTKQTIIFHLPDGKEAVGAVPVFIYVPDEPAPLQSALEAVAAARRLLELAAAEPKVTNGDISLIYAEIKRGEEALRDAIPAEALSTTSSAGQSGQTAVKSGPPSHANL